MSARTTLGCASSNALIAASPLFTERTSKFPSAKVWVTSRRIVGLSSAKRIVRLINVKNWRREVNDDSPPFEGEVDATSKRSREATFDGSGRGGKSLSLSLSYHPVCASKVASHSFFWMAQPPLLQKEGNLPLLRC